MLSYQIDWPSFITSTSGLLIALLLGAQDQKRTKFILTNRLLLYSLRSGMFIAFEKRPVLLEAGVARRFHIWFQKPPGISRWVGGHRPPLNESKSSFESMAIELDLNDPWLTSCY